jgi:NADPH:quinone reductase-like Zn-dependent oxidoreductase
MEHQARALWHEAPGRSVLRRETLNRAEDEVLVRTLWSGVSRGTERLVSEGRVPASEHARMRAPMQAGDFPFPVKYGYAAVGRVEAGPPDLLGCAVFALHPHQDLFVAPAHAVIPLPDGLPPRRATLAANMETALNALWDGAAAPGDRIAVVGAGALGLLVAALAGRIPGADVTVTDVLAQRRDLATQLGVRMAVAPEPLPVDCDVVFHASATGAGLADALAMAGDDGAVVELSWHGAGETPVPLGGAFHSRRLRIVGSQVGALPPSRRPRWTLRRRLETALRLLAEDARLDALITDEAAFETLPDRFQTLLDASGVVTAVRYPEVQPDDAHGKP